MSRAIRTGLIQIDEYGPWTVTPEPRHETDLQSLQASLFEEFATFVGERDGYAFYGRFDNMYAVANEATTEDYRRFQRRVRNRYPVTVSVGVGAGSTPVAALGDASERLQAAGGAQDRDRREALAAGDATPDDTDPVTVAHFDVVDVTGTHTDRRNAVDVTLSVRRATLALATHLRTEHGGLAHFVGGDNVIAVCPDLDPAAYETAIDHVASETGIELQVGIGRGPTAHAAGGEAKHALERCRETGTRIRGTDRTTADD
jgi:GTP cyclohydrolase IIa